MKMLKRINNISIAIFIIMEGIISCGTNQKSIQSETKLITEKLPNGNTVVLGATINGKKEGMWIEYSDNSRILSNYTYIHDSLNGACIHYWEDGTISAIGFLKGDNREGYWTEYYDYKRNKIAEKGVYSSGKKIGIWEYYVVDGKLNKKIKYTENGEQIVLDNHLIPVPPKKTDMQIIDSNNRAFVVDSNGKEHKY